MQLVLDDWHMKEIFMYEHFLVCLAVDDKNTNFNLRKSLTLRETLPVELWIQMFLQILETEFHSQPEVEYNGIC